MSFSNTNRTEYRLYYQANDITKQMKEGDFLAITKKQESFHVIIARHNTTAEKQIMWLFGANKVENSNKFQINKTEDNNLQINFASRFILDILNIEIQDRNKNYFDLLYEKFGDKMPNTSELAQFTLETIKKEIDPIGDPDSAIIKLFGQEEIFYKVLERTKIESKLKNGFIPNNEVNVEEFLQFSLSIQNARKSRAGRALENHLSFVFNSNKILYTRGGITENKSKPDFIFPDIKQYHDFNFSTLGLSMLASKSTCKDRWRQILSESLKIKQKHLFTLEPSISEHQTNEMKANNVTLVLPNEIKSTYTVNQQKDIMNLKDFLLLIKSKQESFFSVVNI